MQEILLKNSISKEHAQNNFHNVASNLTGFQNLSGLVVEVILCTFLIEYETDG